jgi:adenylyltransferase/sulfurtransferase
MNLKGFGKEGQEKLRRGSVLVIGAGGLGCLALQYLAAAGLGRLGIVDDDVVSIDNLHRQLLYNTADVGKTKTVCAAEALSALNPEVDLALHTCRLTNRNALEILNEYDVIIDGTDNFASRYMINDACFLLEKPLVYGSVSGYEGQLAVFYHVGDSGIASNYRDLFPEPPAEGEIPNCEETGVLGVLPGTIGVMQAGEAIKLLTGIGEPLINRLMIYRILTAEVYFVEITPEEKNHAVMPASERAFRHYDYVWFCGDTLNQIPEIDCDDLSRLIGKGGGLAVVDIRNEADDSEFMNKSSFYHIPFSSLEERFRLIAQEKEVVVVCDSGINSRKAVKMLREKYGSGIKFYSLQGGITRWNHYRNEE